MIIYSQLWETNKYHFYKSGNYLADYMSDLEGYREIPKEGADEICYALFEKSRLGGSRGSYFQTP